MLVSYVGWNRDVQDCKDLAIPNAPDEIAIGPTRYVRDDTLCSVRVPDVRETDEPENALWVTEAPPLAVLPVAETAGFPGFGPVYRSTPGGALAVPTGRIFVRFEEQVDAKKRAVLLHEAGYTIESEPSWAPHSAWTVSTTGGVAEALLGIAALLARPGVSHAEPELLRPMGKRAATQPS